MTPKEKAKELCKKYFRTGHNIDYEKEKQYSKLNALICVDEVYFTIINGLDKEDWGIQAKKYWQEVKKEIEKL